MVSNSQDPETAQVPHVTAGMDLESIMVSEIKQPEKDKYYIISLICEIQWEEINK